MTIVRHDALGEPGETHLGPELDCPKCFLRLGDAFRSPATAPTLPHLIMPPDITHTRPLDPQPGPHTTWHKVDPFMIGPGGTWAVGCSCGWEESGRYARDGMGRSTAERLARLKAEQHRRNPLPPPDPPPGHTVRHMALSDVAVGTTPEQGIWTADCSCGWAMGGRYGGPADDIHDFTHARIKAQAEAEAHLANKEDQ